MQAWKILIVVGLVAAVPMVTADHPNCYDEIPRDETLALPNGLYLRVDAEDGGLSLWSELNGEEGLQIHACSDGATPIYVADERVTPAA